MTKNVIKILAVIMIACMLVFSATSIVNADGIAFGDVSTDSVTKNASDDSGAAESIQSIIGSVLTIVQVVGMGVAVIMLIVLAIKYISAAPGDKAEIKKSAVIYVVGAIVLFAATGILQIVKNFANNVKGSSAE